jgi:uncharacterized protein YlxW (UPF0749 family)
VSTPADIAANARNRMNLIEQLSADAVASDYAAAGAVPDGGSQRQHLVVAAAALALAGFVLAIGVSSRLINAPVVDDQRLALLARIESARQSQDDLAGQVEQVRRDVADATAADLELTQAGRQLARQIGEVDVVTGYVAVRGPGAVLTLSDAPPDDSGATGDVERVLDSDVQTAVNGLWRSGAEAVAVNGQRLSALSAIRSAAGAILVNYRPLRPPYDIEAIGSPDSLLERFLASPEAAELRAVADQFGIGFTARSADELQLAGATSSLPDRAAVVEDERGGSQ